MLFAAGILCMDFFSWLQNSWLILFVLLVILFLLSRRNDYRSVTVTNYLFVFSLFVSGAWYAHRHIKEPSVQVADKDFYSGIIQEKPVEKNRSFQTIMAISNPAKGIRKKVIAYFSKQSEAKALCPGTRILFSARLNPIKNKGNPYEFDYRAYMQKQGIWYSVYLRSRDYIIKDQSANNLFILAEKCRDHLLSTIQKHNVNGEEFTVVAALTLGYRKELNPETKDYFASSGAMHVLAVSGLHVGIIYFMFTFLFSPLRNKKYGRIFYTFLIAALIWIYAILSGLSPSVQRAAVMFTFILTGQNLNRPSNIFNSLAASAFLLMLFNPQIIYETGFQLSYLAVTGIVLFQPLFYGMIEVKNFRVDKLWGLFTVSLAAQLSTFPLGLFYFSQFPNFFWLSNFIVIPAATLILGSTFLLLLFSPFPMVADITGGVTRRFTHIMLMCLKWINTLPHVVTGNVSINRTQALLLLLILGVIYWFIKSKTVSELRLALLLTGALGLVSFARNYQLLNQKKMIVYNSDYLVLHFIHGRHNYILTDSVQYNQEQINRLVQNVAICLKLNEPRCVFIGENAQFAHDEMAIRNDIIYFSGKRIQLMKYPEKVFYPVEYRIVFNQPVSLRAYHPGETIILAGKPGVFTNRKFNIYQTWFYGAFITDFKEN